MLKASPLVAGAIRLGVPDDTNSPAKKLGGKRPQPAVSYRFAAPVWVKAVGKPIDTEVGHAPSGFRKRIIQ